MHQQPIQHRLDARKLRGHFVPRGIVVAKLLRLDAAHDPLGLTHERIELFAGANVQAAEALEELRQVLDGRIAEHLGLGTLSIPPAKV